ncbi:MAG: LysR family transcriptional regulator [Pseudomonadota bacterium]
MNLSLNYHHLRYFREVATEGHLGRAAAKLNVSQSALSIQIRALEGRLGQPLFDRVGRTLVLTEAGKIALSHADQIFHTGEALIHVLNRYQKTNPRLRVGALSTMSRNFQLQFLRPLLSESAGRVLLKSGDTASLLRGLERLDLDVVLTTELPPSDGKTTFAAQKIAEQAVEIHATERRLNYDSLAALLACEPLILPTENTIRSGFENLVAKLNVAPKVIAYVDDMAMVRLFAREGVGVAIAPSVVLADEIAQGLVMTAPFDLGINEPFYAVTLPRDFPHPSLQALLTV